MDVIVVKKLPKRIARRQVRAVAEYVRVQESRARGISRIGVGKCLAGEIGTAQGVQIGIDVADAGAVARPAVDEIVRTGNAGGVEAQGHGDVVGLGVVGPGRTDSVAMVEIYPFGKPGRSIVAASLQAADHVTKGFPWIDRIFGRCGTKDCGYQAKERQ